MNSTRTRFMLRSLRVRLEDSVRLLPRFIFVRHFKTIETLIFLCVLGSAGYLLFQLFWGELHGVPETTPEQRLQLSETTLDELEFWIEEQRDQFERGLPLGTREYFVREAVPR